MTRRLSILENRDYHCSSGAHVQSQNVPVLSEISQPQDRFVAHKSGQKARTLILKQLILALSR